MFCIIPGELIQAGNGEVDFGQSEFESTGRPKHVEDTFIV